MSYYNQQPQLQKRKTNVPGTTSINLNTVDLKKEKVVEEKNGNYKPTELFLRPDLYPKNQYELPTLLIKSKNANQWLDFYKTNRKLIWVAFFTILSMFTRYYNIGYANKPVWDEVHFGKFGSHYLRGHFYHDVHPPLGKMLVGMAGKLAGYDGTFKFEGGDYPQNLNYTIMRLFTATFGMLLVPLAYLTADKLNFSHRAQLLAAWLVLFDNGFTVISRFILLDSMLILFIAMSLHFFVTFHGLRNEAFSTNWCLALFATGISLGLASSVKWIGFFVVALVGLYTISDLWEKFSQPMPKGTYIRHWIVRILCLIIVPLVVYITCFKLHFAILNNSGPGDATMDSLFQARLNNNKVKSSPIELVMNSNVTIRSYAMDGGLLHSHGSDYPEGSKQQQITCYNYKDSNNDWYLEPTDDFNFQTASNTHSSDSKVGNAKVVSGDTIKLVHVPTKKILAVNPDHDSLITGRRAHMVSGVDNDNTTVTAPNQVWRVEIYDDLLLSRKPNVVNTLSTRFQLRNPNTGCLLASLDKSYPAWGFNQREVYCVKDSKSMHVETLWNIEELVYPNMVLPEHRNIPPTFYRDFFRIHQAMWSTNNALIPDEDKFDHLTSHATDWPLSRRGIRMCGWGDNEIKYYMLSNPLVVWSTTLALVIYAILYVGYRIRMQRRIREWRQSEWEHFSGVGYLIGIGYLLQYLPFFLMGRVLYTHHYFPSLYFACFMLPYILEFFTKSFKPRFKDAVFLIVAIIILLGFIYFSPLTFGYKKPSADLASKMWLQTWRFTGPEVA